MTPAGHNDGPIRVVLVDDSLICRHQLKQVLEAAGEIEVVAEGESGEEALALLAQHRPDLLLVDLIMPGQGGQETVAMVMAQHPLPILVLTAQPAGVRQLAAFDAIRRGALDLAEKPRRGDVVAEAQLRKSVRTLASVAVVRHLAGSRRRDEALADRQHGAALVRRDEPMSSLSAQFPVQSWNSPSPSSAVLSRSNARHSAGATSRRVPVVAIGASAGGPTPLATLLGLLRADFGAAVAVVQHLPNGFAEAFAEYLRSRIPLKVKAIKTKELMQAGTVYIASDDRHLVASGADHFALSTAPPCAGHRPSVDVLFSSLVANHSSRTCAIILSGIGQDGVLGLGNLRKHGALTMAQSQDSCAVFGMPQAAIQTGAARLALSPEAMANELAGWNRHQGVRQDGQ